MFSHLTFTTLKTGLNLVTQNNIGCINPWITFQKGILPIGLATAYQEKHGFDPLRVSRVYLWLSNFRDFASKWIIALVIFSIASPIFIKEGYLKVSAKDPILWGIALLSFGIVLGLIFTRKKHKLTREKMLAFQSAILSFACEFSSLFDHNANPVSASTDKDELLERVSNIMIESAQEVMVNQVVGFGHGYSKWELSKKSSAANDVGLGREWSYYFYEASKVVNAYEAFTWEI